MPLWAWCQGHRSIWAYEHIRLTAAERGRSMPGRQGLSSEGSSAFRVRRQSHGARSTVVHSSMHVVGWKGPSSPIRDDSEIGSLEVLWAGLLGAGICTGICRHLQAGAQGHVGQQQQQQQPGPDAEGEGGLAVDDGGRAVLGMNKEARLLRRRRRRRRHILAPPTWARAQTE